MKYLLIAAGLSLYLTSPGLAADAPTGETLVVPDYPVDGPWKKTVLKEDGTMHWEESIPEKESETDVRNIVTVQTIYAFKEQKPASFVTALAERINGQCENMRLEGPQEKTENGHVVAYAFIFCTNKKGIEKNSDVAVKVIGGKDALYVVQREFRYPLPPPDQPKLSDRSSSQFPTAQFTEAITRIRALAMAQAFLVERVQLCSSTQGTNCPAKASP